MIRTAAGVALLFTSLTLTATAQNGSTSGATFGSEAPETLTLSGGTTIVLPPISDRGACPISMQANQGLWDRTIRIREGDKGRGLHPFGQRISLNLRDPRSARIVSATVRVHGLNGKNRMLPTPADASRKWNAVTTLKVKFVEENDGTVSGDLWIDGFTSVSSIKLVDVSYSDGSVWTISGSNACRVQPNPVMLITER